MLRTRYATLCDVLADQARDDPQRRTIIFINEDGARQIITVGELHREATAVAYTLAAVGIQPQELVLLLTHYSRGLLAAFLGVMYRGAIPSIVSYFSARLDSEVSALRVRDLVADSGARAVITAPELVPRLTELLIDLRCQVLNSEEFIADAGSTLAPAAPQSADAIAFIQFSSGTTGRQKGVPMTHGLVLEFIDTLCRVYPIRTNDVMVSWLPLYHDMGLITALLLPLLMEIPAVLMSPFYWVREPVALLRAIHEFNGTLSWMPNFAFNHCVRNIRERDVAGLDLSRWRAIINAAEPVRDHTMAAFWHRFAPYGLARSALKTAYGMAEAVLAVTITQTDDPPRVDWVRLAELQTQRRAVPTSAGESGATSLVSNGTPLPSVTLAIVDESGATLADRHVGEITLRCTHLFNGYYRRSDLSAAVLQNGRFHTGDIGYLADGELFVCGRKKDLIIVGGTNIHPEDIETIADGVAGVQPGRSVAFGVMDDRLGTERIVLACELRPELAAEEPQRIDRELRRLVLQHLEVTLSDVRFVERGWVLKTSSGKITRSANRDKYLHTIAATEPT
jgi:acyl-CoA synthetase (AMP-forming)/AMP-acid ligase II